MTTLTLTRRPAEGMTRDERRVIFASSLGTVFEWYDFYLYGLLATILSAQFFSGVNETTANLLAPIVVDQDSKRAMQVILNGTSLPVRAVIARAGQIHFARSIPASCWRRGPSAPRSCCCAPGPNRRRWAPCPTTASG